LLFAATTVIALLAAFPWSVGMVLAIDSCGSLGCENAVGRASSVNLVGQLLIYAAAVVGMVALRSRVVRRQRYLVVVLVAQIVLALGTGIFVSNQTGTRMF